MYPKEFFCTIKYFLTLLKYICILYQFIYKIFLNIKGEPGFSKSRVSNLASIRKLQGTIKKPEMLRKITSSCNNNTLFIIAKRFVEQKRIAFSLIFIVFFHYCLVPSCPHPPSNHHPVYQNIQPNSHNDYNLII